MPVDIVRKVIRSRANGNCELCRCIGTKQNPLDLHHIKGKKFNHPDDIMLVHSRTCHVFAQWLTNLYLLSGEEDKLTRKFTNYVFNRIITIRENEQFIFPLYR